jgi:hypothetical protein
MPPKKRYSMAMPKPKKVDTPAVPRATIRRRGHVTAAQPTRPSQRQTTAPQIRAKSPENVVIMAKKKKGRPQKAPPPSSPQLYRMSMPPR